MSRDPFPFHPQVNGRGGMEIPDRIDHARMVVQAGVQPFKRTGSRHIVFAIEHLFRRAAKNFDGSGDIFLLHMIFERDRGPDRRCADQIVAAAMAVGVAAFSGGLLGYRVIAQPREGIKLDQIAQDGRAAAPGRNPRSIQPADAPVADGEASLLQGLTLIGRAFEFLVSQFGEFPDLEGHIPNRVG